MRLCATLVSRSTAALAIALEPIALGAASPVERGLCDAVGDNRGAAGLIHVGANSFTERAAFELPGAAKGCAGAVVASSAYSPRKNASTSAAVNIARTSKVGAEASALTIPASRRPPAKGEALKFAAKPAPVTCGACIASGRFEAVVATTPGATGDTDVDINAGANVEVVDAAELAGALRSVR